MRSGSVAIAILAPIVFVLVATYAELKVAVLLIRLCFLPVTVLLVLRRR